jgi:hypothetical protein
MSSIEPGGDPVSTVDQPPRDEVRPDGRALVARVDARVERPRPLFLFPEMEQDERPS